MHDSLKWQLLAEGCSGRCHAHLSTSKRYVFCLRYLLSFLFSEHCNSLVTLEQFQERYYNLLPDYECSSMLSAAFLCYALAFAQANLTQNVTPSVLKELRLFSEYSSVAYCPKSYIKGAKPSVACPETVCPLLQNSSVQIVRSFANVSEHQTTGLVMLDHPRQLIVISFRGTVTDVDWGTDLEFVQSHASDICKGCLAHTGFLGSWRDAEGIVLKAWSSLQSQYSGYTTVVTGHSLGGALAHLCAARLKGTGPSAPISLYTYGSPRVGNQAFASFIESKFGSSNHRATHLNDPVPRQPIRAIGYVHAGPEYHITSPHIPGALSADSSVLTQPANLVVNPSDVFVISGPENKRGNVGYCCANPAMHDEYVGFIPGCLSHNQVMEGK